MRYYLLQNATHDTLIAFSPVKSLTRFYKSEEKLLLDSVDVTERNFIRMAGGLDIGNSKSNFLEFFNKRGQKFGDSIAVTDDEANNIVYFFFKNDRLDRIQILPW